MFSTRFPNVETVRSAIREFPPNKLEFYERTRVKPHWLYAFMANRAGAGAARYENVAKVIEWLEEREQVVFLGDSYAKRVDDQAA